MRYKILVGILVSAFILLSGCVTDKKSCSVDSDCVMVCDGCCCLCGGHTDVVNKGSADFIKLTKTIKCFGVSCPLASCIYPLTEDLPVCREGQCAVEKIPLCEGICYYAERSGNLTDTLRYLDGRAEKLNKTGEELLLLCNCSIQDQGVTVSTDKTEYEQGEEISFTIKNNSSLDVFLTQRRCADDLGDHYQEEQQSSVPFLQRFENNEWGDVKWHYFPADATAAKCLRSLECISKVEDINFSRMPTDFIGESLNPGRYRLKLSFGRSCQRNVGLYDTFTVYSNEFTIKEREITVGGEIAVIGNEPFNRLVIITDEDVTYVITTENIEVFERLWKEQGKRAKLRGYMREGTYMGEGIEVTGFEILE
ncbi:MAG: hypothetical protein JW778_05410 [Candidatus Altiarchaeota archaeon]|nr:hypothetical protein [Candidatus Altiarchaeota archaeon]